MRSIHAVTLILALLLGLVEAPFAHIHELGIGEDHHANQQTHVHAWLNRSNDSGSAFEAIDPADGEHATDWFQAVPYAGFSLWIVPTQACLPKPIDSSEFLRPAPPVRSHDPPSHSRRPARAPPSIPA